MARGPLLGVQFHPERSGADGLRLLANFVDARAGRLMLRHRVIPCLDVADGRVVKGTRFVDLVDEGDPPELAERYAAEGADELVFLDITAAPERRGTLLDIVERTARRAFIPLTVGGGVRSVTEMRDVLRAGADKVSLNTAAVADPTLIARCAGRFGRQAVVVAIDARRRPPGRAPRWEVVVQGGRQPTDLDAVAWAERAVDLGAGELLVTSIDRDGTGSGFDTALLRAIAVAGPGAGHRVRWRRRPGRFRRRGPRWRRRRGPRRVDLPSADPLDRRRQGRDGGGRPAGPPRPAGRRVTSDPVVGPDVAFGRATASCPPIVQDAVDGRVLMLAWMDAEALAATARDRRGPLPLASRDRLWRKGETSGNMLRLVELATDCDARRRCS